MSLKTCLILSLFVCLSFAGYLPQNYKQNDPKWKDSFIGFGSKTIGEDGSLLTSLASVAAGLGIFSHGTTVYNPLTLNQWLKNHKGFVQDDQIVWDSLAPLGVDFVGFTTDVQDMIHAIIAGDPIILNVKGGSHYVVGVFVVERGFLVMDPGQTGDLYYSFQEIVKAGIYKVQLI